MNSNDTYKKKICKIKLIVPHNRTKMATFHTIKSGAGGLRVAETFHPPKEKRYSWGGGRGEGKATRKLRSASFGEKPHSK